MKKAALLLCLFTAFAFGYTDFDAKAKDRLCELYRDQDLAKFYGQYRELNNIQKRIDNYKFRFGIGDEFDGSQCDLGRGYDYYGYGRDRRGYEYERDRRDSYNDGYYDGYERGRYDNDRRNYRKGY